MAKHVDLAVRTRERGRHFDVQRAIGGVATKSAVAGIVRPKRPGSFTRSRESGTGELSGCVKSVLQLTVLPRWAAGDVSTAIPVFPTVFPLLPVPPWRRRLSATTGSREPAVLRRRRPLLGLSDDHPRRDLHLFKALLAREQLRDAVKQQHDGGFLGFAYRRLANNKPPEWELEQNRIASGCQRLIYSTPISMRSSTLPTALQ